MVEERRQRLAQDPVALVLEPVDLDRVVVDVLERPQARHRAVDLARRLVQDVRHALGLLHRRLDPVEAEEVGDLLDEVDDVVQADARAMMSSRSNGVTNVWLSRWMMSCVMRSPSCSQTTTSRSSPPWSGHCSSIVLEQLGGADAVAPRLLEEVEELSFLGREDLGQPTHRRASVCERVVIAGRGAPRASASGGSARAPPGRSRRCARAPGSWRVRTSSA